MECGKPREMFLTFELVVKIEVVKILCVERVPQYCENSL